MSTRELIKKQLNAAAVAAGERCDALRQELARCDDPARRKVLALKITDAAAEWHRTLQALFETPRTL